MRHGYKLTTVQCVKFRDSISRSAGNWISWPVNPYFWSFFPRAHEQRFVATHTKPHIHFLFAKNLLFRDLLCFAKKFVRNFR